MSDQGWFLMVYGGLLAALLTASVVVWRRSQPEADDTVDLTDVELAALNGGPQLAAITAATALRRSHVTSTADGTLVAQGPLADDAGQLERELFDTLGQSPASPAKTLVDNAARGATVERIVTRLTEAGLRLGDDARLWLTALWICAGAVVTAGAVRRLRLLGGRRAGLAGARATGCAGGRGRRRAALARHASQRRDRGRAPRARPREGQPQRRAARRRRAARVRARSSAAPPCGPTTRPSPPRWTSRRRARRRSPANAAAFGWGWDASCGGCGSEAADDPPTTPTRNRPRLAAGARDRGRARRLSRSRRGNRGSAPRRARPGPCARSGCRSSRTASACRSAGPSRWIAAGCAISARSPSASTRRSSASTSPSCEPAASRPATCCPVQRTAETLDILSENVAQAMERLPAHQRLGSAPAFAGESGRPIGMSTATTASPGRLSTRPAKRAGLATAGSPPGASVTAIQPALQPSTPAMARPAEASALKRAGPCRDG